MTTARKRLTQERMQWVEYARQGILVAVGEDVVHPQFKIFPTVDPLKFILKITLRMPLAKKTREPLRTYLRSWAGEFGCELPIINIEKAWVQAEVLTQHRKWSRDAKGRFKGGRRFESRPR